MLSAKNKLAQLQNCADQLASAKMRLDAQLPNGEKFHQIMEEIIRLTSAVTLSSLPFWETIMRGNDGWCIQRTSTQAPPNWTDVSAARGFRREALLRARSASPNALFFALALRRLNDWVPEVRTAARECVTEIAYQSDIEHVVGGLIATLTTWQHWERITNAERDVVMQLLESRSIAIRIKQRIISAPTGAMSSVLAQVTRWDIFDAELPDFSTSALQPAVRAKAYEMQLMRKAIFCTGYMRKWTKHTYGKGDLVPLLAERALSVQAKFLPTLEHAIADRSSLVRRVGAEYLVRNYEVLGEHARPLANQLARDRVPSIAARALYVLDHLSTC